MDDSTASLIERMKGSVDQIELPLPSSDRVRRRARRRRGVAFVAGIGAAGLLAAGVIVPIAALLPLTPRQSPPSAGTSSDTYILSEIEIEYPYRHLSGGSSVEDATRVGVSFVSEWSRPTYPGEAKCILRVFDSGGTEVGSREIGYSTLEPTGRSTLAHPVPVHVVDSSGPVSATADCGPATPPSGGYRFENLHVVSTPTPHLVGDIDWTGEMPPFDQRCTAIFESRGETLAIEFTLSSGEGRSRTILILDEALDGAILHMLDCQAKEGGP